MEYVVLVDENDTELGIEEKLKAHQLGQLHRAFSVCIVRKREGKWQVLLQQRATDKYHSGGLWTNTCCSHPRPNETIKAAAERRLKEEMGIEADLKLIGKFIYRAELDNQLVEHELDHVLIGELTDTAFQVSPAEVMAHQWVDLSLLINKINENSAPYTAWLKDVITIVETHLQDV